MRALTILCSFSVFLLFLGCSHQHYVSVADQDAMRTVSDRGAREVCVVRTQDEESYKAKELMVDVETLRWLDASSGEPVAVPMARVNRIVFVDHSKGLIEGAGVGFSIGALFGGFLGYLSGTDEPDGSEFGDYTRSGGVALGIVVFGVPAAVLGAVVGGAGGSRDFYYPVSADSLTNTVREPPD